MAGLMGVTAFLSMWINNTAATSIMLPVALAITHELQNHDKNSQAKKDQIKEGTAAVNRNFLIEIFQWTNYSLFPCLFVLQIH